MRIALMVEGETEKVFLPYLRGFLELRLPGKMPRIEVFRYDGRIPKEGQLKGVVRRLLRDPKRPADAVIALTDVYTGTRDFTDAADAKAKMRAWVGDEPRFFPHAAQHDFEAWLLPYWPAIKQLSGSSRPAIQGPPEQVNHDQPPAYRLKVYTQGQKRNVTQQIRRELKRRSTVEPVIGHLKSDHRMDRNYLAGRAGDAANAVLASVGYNFRLLLNWLALLCARILAMISRDIAFPTALLTT